MTNTNIDLIAERNRLLTAIEGLRKLVAAEYPQYDLGEIAAIWGPDVLVTTEEIEAIRTLPGALTND